VNRRRFEFRTFLLTLRVHGKTNRTKKLIHVSSKNLIDVSSKNSIQKFINKDYAFTITSLAFTTIHCALMP
jgi:hypothetical protein